MVLTDAQKLELLSLARHTLDQEFFPSGEPLKFSHDAVFSERHGVFVTLRKNGELRGCIGAMIGRAPVYELTQAMAYNAAFRDPRFRPLTVAEWSEIRIEMSILSDMISIRSVAEVVVGRDGLWLTTNGHSGVLLPKVAVEWGWDAPEFVRQVFQKAGLRPQTEWADGEMHRFEAVEFGEPGLSR